MQKKVRNNYYLKTAHKLALTSTYGRFRLGAIAVKNNRIVSMGTNQKKSHPIQAKFTHRPHLESWLHAEIHCISLAKPKDIEGSYIYVSRVLKCDDPATSRPCPGCVDALKHYKVKGMYYFQDGNYYYEDLNV